MSPAGKDCVSTRGSLMQLFALSGRGEEEEEEVEEGDCWKIISWLKMVSFPLTLTTATI